MMWDLSGGRHTSTHRVAMPVPSLALPETHHRARRASTPGPPSPGWSATPARTPPPMPVPASFAHSEAAAPTPHDRERGGGGFLIVQPRHHRHSHSHSHSPSRHHHQQAAAVIIRPSSAAPVVMHQPQQQHRPSHTQQHHAPHPAPGRPLRVPPMPAVLPQFQYSRCTGRRRALCIGINYRGQHAELRGCINDAKHVFNFLVRRYGYKPENIVVLTDDSPNQRGLPTRKNMIDAMHWLVKDAQPHDSLFFHYSGHGGQTRDLDGDEVDGFDETIYPVDYRHAGHIVDDEMHQIMVKPLPAGCRLTAVFDSCHSGTVLDLPYIYDSRGRLKGSQITSRARSRKATPADVISWSGCKDGQTSADTFADGEAVGAASHAFIKAIDMNPHQSYQELLTNVRKILSPKFSQKPQLGSSHPINTSLRFIM